MGITPACAGKTTAVFFFNIASQDHPRVCGENMSLNPSSAARRGSPPRVRGKRNEITQPQRDDRITPAHAGKTHRNKRNVALKKDHPRACGENPYDRESHGGNQGSPPRMRGKRRNLRQSHPVQRITPAHAGKTQGQLRPSGNG